MMQLLNIIAIFVGTSLRLLLLIAKSLKLIVFLLVVISD